MATPDSEADHCFGRLKSGAELGEVGINSNRVEEEIERIVRLKMSRESRSVAGMDPGSERGILYDGIAEQI